MLNRMQDDKLVHSDRDHNNQPLVWMLPNVKYPNNFYLRQHELDCADTFIAFFPYLTYWASPYGEYRRNEYKSFIQKHLEPDRLMYMNGKSYCIEIDRGTEDETQLEDKIDKYIAYSKAHRGFKFNVLITLQKYRRMNLANRLGIIHAMLQEKGRDNQFLVGIHDQIIPDPLGKTWTSPVDPTTYISLLDV